MFRFSFWSALLLVLSGATRADETGVARLYQDNGQWHGSVVILSWAPTENGRGVALVLTCWHCVHRKQSWSAHRDPLQVHRLYSSDAHTCPARLCAAAGGLRSLASAHFERSSFRPILRTCSMKRSVGVLSSAIGLLLIVLAFSAC